MPGVLLRAVLLTSAHGSSYASAVRHAIGGATKVALLNKQCLTDSLTTADAA